MRGAVVTKQVVAFVVVLMVLVAGSVAAGHLAYERLTRSTVVTVPRLVEAASSVTLQAVNCPIVIVGLAR